MEKRLKELFNEELVAAGQDPIDCGDEWTEMIERVFAIREQEILAKANAQISALKAVLIGQDFERVDDLAERSVAFCLRVGQAAKDRVLEIQAELAAANAEIERMQTKMIEGARMYAEQVARAERAEAERDAVVERMAMIENYRPEECVDCTTVAPLKAERDALKSELAFKHRCYEQRCDALTRTVAELAALRERCARCKTLRYYCGPSMICPALEEK